MMTFTHSFVAGGYSVVSACGTIRIEQPFDPLTGLPYATPEAAEAAAQAEVARLDADWNQPAA